MRPASRALGAALAAALFVFVVLSDWVILNGPLLVARRGLVAAVALAAVAALILRRREIVRAVLVPPPVYFLGFVAAGAALAPTALAPVASAEHAAVFLAVAVFAAAIAVVVPLERVFLLLRVAFAVKLLGSLAVGLAGGRFVNSPIVGPNSGGLGDRHHFGGLYGNANALAVAAASYLVLAACHLIEKRGHRRPGARGLLQLAGAAVTTFVALFLMWQSLSRTAWVAAVITGATIAALALWRAAGASAARRALVVAGASALTAVGIVLLLSWMDVSRHVASPQGGTAERVWEPIASGAILDASERPLFWRMAVDRIRQRPWTGYGMVATPVLYAAAFAGRPEHAHNLELEAALYAGVPAALVVVAFMAATLRAAILGFLARDPLSLTVLATLVLYFALAQVEPVILGSPYPTLPVVLVLAAHLGRQAGAICSSPRAAG